MDKNKETDTKKIGNDSTHSTQLKLISPEEIAERRKRVGDQVKQLSLEAENYVLKQMEIEAEEKLKALKEGKFLDKEKYSNITLQSWACENPKILTTDSFDKHLQKYKWFNPGVKMDEKDEKLCIYVKRKIAESNAELPLKDVKLTVVFDSEGSKGFKITKGTCRENIRPYYDEKTSRNFNGS